MQTSGTDSASSRKRKSVFSATGFKYDRFKLIKRNRTGTYYVEWYNSRNRRTTRKTTNTCDLQQAKSFLIDLAYESQRRTSKLRSSEEVPVNETFNSYLEEKMLADNRSRPTAIAAITKLTRYFEEFDIAMVADLTPRVIDGYGSWRQENCYQNLLGERRRIQKIKGIANTTLRRELNVLTAALNYFYKTGQIDRVPTISKPNGWNRRERWLTQTEARQLIEAAYQQHVQDFIILGLHTIQRPGHLYDLKVNQVDLERRVIDFRKFDVAENCKRRPVIRMTESIVPILTRLCQQSQSGYVLEYGGERIKTDLRHGFRRAVSKAGLANPKEVVPYTLRHTGATWLAQSGISMWEIAGMMGHSSTAMVEKIYAKHSPDFQSSATHALDKMLNAPLKS